MSNIAIGGVIQLDNNKIYWIEIDGKRSSVIYDLSVIEQRDKRRSLSLDNKLSYGSLLKCILAGTIVYEDSRNEMDIYTTNDTLIIKGVRLIYQLFENIGDKNMFGFGNKSSQDIELYNFINDPINYLNPKTQDKTMITYGVNWYLSNLIINSRLNIEATKQLQTNIIDTLINRFNEDVIKIVMFIFKYSDEQKLNDIVTVYKRDYNGNVNIDFSVINPIYWMASTSDYAFIRNVNMVDKDNKFLFTWSGAMNKYFKQNQVTNLRDNISNSSVFQDIAVKSGSSINIPDNKGQIITVNKNVRKIYLNYIQTRFNDKKSNKSNIENNVRNKYSDGYKKQGDWFGKKLNKYNTPFYRNVDVPKENKIETVQINNVLNKSNLSTSKNNFEDFYFA